MAICSRRSQGSAGSNAIQACGCLRSAPSGANTYVAGSICPIHTHPIPHQTSSTSTSTWTNPLFGGPLDLTVAFACAPEACCSSMERPPTATQGVPCDETTRSGCS
jgi:hypothetical protein